MIYLDSAATTLQKPKAVAQAVAWAIQNCASPGRGDHSSTRQAERIMYRCREELSHLFGAQGPEQVVFTQNATHALNLAIRTLVHAGDRVLISAWEHNAVTRTLASIPNVKVMVAKAPLFDDRATLEAFRYYLAEGPSVVVCTCVSNVFGYILPYEEICRLCRRAGVPVILDASQAAGILPVRLDECNADYIAFPGHKGLYGPQGTGALVCGVERSLEPLLTGGTGSESKRQQMPDYLPDRGEAGTQNVAGIAGLLEGTRYVRKTGLDRIFRHEQQLMHQLEGTMQNCAPLTGIFSSRENQAGVVSFDCGSIDCQDLAQDLGKAGIAVRSGLHCAPLAHRNAGTLSGGTLRISFSPLNTVEEIEQFSRVVRQIIHNKLT